MNEVTIALFTIFLLLLIFIAGPVREAIKEKFTRYKVIPTTLKGSDRGSIRGDWRELNNLSHKCACHFEHKVLRNKRCYKDWDRGTDYTSMPICKHKTYNQYQPPDRTAPL